MTAVRVTRRGYSVHMAQEPVHDVVEGQGFAVANVDALGDRYGFRKIRRELGVQAMGMNAIAIPPGYETGRHYHEEQEETYFIHRGTVEMTFGDGTSHVLGPGGIARVDAPTVRKLLDRIQQQTGWEVRVLSGAEEAYYGYLAVVNSTTLADGFSIDMGGGSIQLCRIEERRLQDAESLPLGAVRVSEAFLTDEESAGKQMKKLAKHVAEQVERLGWWGGTPRLAGIGGSIRNLAAAAQKLGGYPDGGVQGFMLTARHARRARRRAGGPPGVEARQAAGIKPDRGDVILGAALVLASVMDSGGFEAIEVTEAGLREGIFFERFLDGVHPALIDDVRDMSVDNLARRYGHSGTHARHVEHLSLELYDGLAESELLEPSPADRELLARACALHDIGVAIHYDDHHKHSRYLILNSGLPGFDQRELELISLIAHTTARATRTHRPSAPLPSTAIRSGWRSSPASSGSPSSSSAGATSRCATCPCRARTARW